MDDATQPLLSGLYTLASARAELAEILDVYDDSDEQERAYFDTQLASLREFIDEREASLHSEGAHRRHTLAELEAEVALPQHAHVTSTLRREIACRKALETSPFDLGEEVVLGPTWRMGARTGDGGSYVFDCGAGKQVRVTGFSPDGEIWIDDEHLMSAHPSRVFKIDSQRSCPCGAWGDAHKPMRHAAGCAR